MHLGVSTSQMPSLSCSRYGSSNSNCYRQRRSISTGRTCSRAQASRRGEVLLIADGVGKTHSGEKMLFYNLSFSVVAGDKLAVIGQNGSGKSSLLKIIAGTDYPDSGTISRNKGASIGYLPQDPVLPEGSTVLQAVLQSDSDMARAVQDYQQALATANGALTKELEASLERMNTLNAWQVDADAKRVLEAVGLLDVNAQVNKLSGGQRKRVALAAALLGSPDLLVLDEPTNHMDVDMIRVLEGELARDSLALVLVSHDRAFMEATCDRLLELDAGRAVIHNFGGPGSYEQYREARAARRAAQDAAAADARTLFRREAEWASRQPKARQKKSKGRVQRLVELTERTKDTAATDLRADFSGMGMARQGNKVLRLERVFVSVAGRQIIRDFTFELAPGARLGVAGPNGAGKSTLLDLISGVRRPDSGLLVMGDTTEVGYFTQHPPHVRNDLRLIDYVRETAELSKARREAADPGDSPETLLEKVGFPRARQFQRVESLSGGERRRLHLASVLVARPNLLILDEPTNDLDLQTVEVLEELLRSYRGTLLVVSHDRAFMDGAVDSLLVLEGDGLVRYFEGDYSEYLELLDKERGGPVGKGLAASNARPVSGTNSNGNGNGAAVAPPKTRKLDPKEQQEYRRLPKEVDKLRAKANKLNEQLMALAGEGADYTTLSSASEELAAVTTAIDEKSERWLQLAEIAGDI